MAESISEQIAKALDDVEMLYHRLVLLVGVSNSGKTGVLQDVATDRGSNVINVNLELSSRLLELTLRQRSLRLAEALDQAIGQRPSPVLLDNLEILFSQELQQDPMRLLQGLSRNRTVLAVWNGTFAGGQLKYAEISHPEYRVYDAVEARIIVMGRAAPVE